MTGLRRYERYVAIGDSSTEGLDDPDPRGGYHGWANRLAQTIADAQGSVLYANLGIRGKLTREIRDRILGGSDPLPAHLHDLTAADVGVERPTAHAIARLEDNHLETGGHEVERGGESGQSRAHDRHVCVARRRRHDRTLARIRGARSAERRYTGGGGA